MTGAPASNGAIVVSGCDSAYFPMIRELWHSMRECGAFDRVDFGVLDLGLSGEERQWFADRTIELVRPPWPYEGVEGRAPEWFKAMVCRPFLPDYFRDREFIFWIDADSWIQDALALDLFVEAARLDGFAVVPAVDRGYGPSSKWAPQWFKGCLEQGFGPEIAETYQNHPIIAAGALCGAATAQHWKLWQEYTRRALERNVFREAEQTALSLMVHESKLDFHQLPSHCHWVCNMRVPAYDTETRKFVEPYLPHRPIGIMGLGDRTKTDTVGVEILDGRILPRRLRFGAIEGPWDGQPKVTLNDAEPKAEVDGIFKARYLDAVFARISGEGKVRIVQIGAMDGVTADPVHRAILRHGWTGVLVEPLADMMQKLKATYSGCEGLGFEMAAITESPGDHRMYRVSPDAIDDGRAPDWAGGISSLYLDRNALSGQRVTEEDAARIRPFIVEETVAGIVFDDLVAKHGIDRMDVLQIDTEGADLMILRQVDLSKFRPKVIHLEFYNLPPTDKSACVELLKSHGYRVYIGADGVDLLSLRG